STARNASTSPQGTPTSGAPSTTPSSPSPTRSATSSPGRRPARSASRDRASRPRSPRRWRPRPRPGGPWSTGCARLTCSSRAQARGGRPPSGPSRRPAWRSGRSRTSRPFRTTAAGRRNGAGAEEYWQMAPYTRADCKLCRREKMKLYLKGAKCDSPKCPIEIRPYPPGEHGRNRPKESEYLLQIREKQKARRVYGILERQFHGYYEEASRKRGKTGENLLQILE